LFVESNKIEPDICGDEPESITDKPPYLTDGLFALTVIILVPTFKVDEEIYNIEDVDAFKFITVN